MGLYAHTECIFWNTLMGFNYLKLKTVGERKGAHARFLFKFFFFNCLLFNQLFQNFQNYETNKIFKKVQWALENVLAGTFLPLGKGLATPGSVVEYLLMEE